MKKNSVFGLSFILFAFALPAISWAPEFGAKSTSAASELVATPTTAVIKPIEKTPEEILEDYIDDTFDEMDLRGTGLKKDIFSKAVIGYHNLKNANLVSSDKEILSIVDLGKASRYKRLWIIDLNAKKLLFHSLVAHGQGSGGDKAEAFSDQVNSHQSSLGFYVTSNTYIGKHGISLKLNGMDAGFNKNAYERAIVVHGAEYVSKDFIKSQGRLGRSHGCPAIPVELTKPIINTIKNKTVLYIDGNIDAYASQYLNKSIAAVQFAQANNTLTAKL